MRYVAAFLSAVAITSTIASPYIYNQPGQNYRLSRTELAEIERVVARRPGILKPIDAIGLLRSDYAQVESGGAQRDGDLTTWFHIRKLRGHGTVEERKVKATKAVFTD
jgi:hypothetical protein